MTNLQQRALARVAMTRETVEDIYTGHRSGTDEQCLKAVCESHERLRAEVEGCEVLLEENQKEIAALKARLERREKLVEVLRRLIDDRVSMEEFKAAVKEVTG